MQLTILKNIKNMINKINKLAISNGQLTISHCFLPIARCSFSIAYCPLHIAYFLLLFAYFLLPFASDAQTIVISKTLNLEEITTIVLKNNLTLKAHGFDIQSTQSLLKTTKELPKMEANLQLGQYNSIKFDNGFQVSQVIPFPTVFEAKKGLIQAEIKGKEAQQKITEAELKNQVRTYYYQLLFLQNNQNKLQYLDTLYFNFVQAAALRYKTGATKKLELTTAETKRGEIELLLQQNETDIANIYQNLKALMNNNDDFTVIFSNYKPLTTNDLLEKNVVLKNPTIAAFYQDALVQDENIKLEKALAKPDFKVGYSNQSLIGFQTIDNQNQYFGAGKRFNSVNLGIAIPLNKTASKARIQSFDFQKQVAQTNALQQKNHLETLLKNAISQYKQGVLQYNYYQNQALPNAVEIVKAAKLGYQTGDIDYVEYLYALQTATDIELKFLQSIHQINQAVNLIKTIVNE